MIEWELVHICNRYVLHCSIIIPLTYSFTDIYSLLVCIHISLYINGLVVSI